MITIMIIILFYKKVLLSINYKLHLLYYKNENLLIYSFYETISVILREKSYVTFKNLKIKCLVKYMDLRGMKQKKTLNIK
jgi:hypothetical protein